MKVRFSRFVLLLIAEVFLLVLILPGCFRAQHSLYGGDISGMTREVVAEGGYDRYQSDYLSLSPGVYRIYVQSDLKPGQRLSVEMQYEEAPFHSMLGNVAWILPGEQETDFEIYVSAGIDTAYLNSCLYGAEGSESVRIEVYETGIGSRLLFVLTLAVFLLVDGLLLYRKRILEGIVTGRQQMVFWALVALVLVAYYPMLADCIYLGTESLFHLERIAQLKEALLQGASLPVRMSGGWLYGHGYGASYFHSDLWLLVPAGLMLVGFPLMHAYMIYVLLILVVTAACSYVAFRKCVKEEWGALLGTALYMLAPCYLTNLYNRGALGTFTAMAFLPLVCCGIWGLLQEDTRATEYKNNKWYLILGAGAMLHGSVGFTCMIFVMVAMVLLLCGKRTLRKETLLQLFQGAGIFLLLNAWFWIPMLYVLGRDVLQLRQSLDSVRGQGGMLFAHLLQLLPAKGNATGGVWQGEPVTPGVGALLVVALYGVRRFLCKKKEVVLDVLVLMLVLVLGMSSYYFPWKWLAGIPVLGRALENAAYPAIWLLPAAALVAMLGAFLYKHMEPEGTLKRIGLGIVLAVTLMAGIYQVNRIGFEMTPTRLYEEENIGTAFVGDGAYLPVETSLADMSYHAPISREGLVYTDYQKQGTEISLVVNNTAVTECYLELPLLAYPGYTVDAAKGVTEPYITEETGAHGDLRIAVPAGYSGTIRVYYEGAGIFRLAEVGSLLSVVLIIGSYFYNNRKKVRDGK